jgi:protein phosphatase
VLTNAVGGSSQKLMVEFHRVELTQDDVVLLCTDGLTTHVSDEAIRTRLAGMKRGSVADTTRSLVQSALDDGGTDNVTVVIARF